MTKVSISLFLLWQQKYFFQLTQLLSQTTTSSKGNRIHLTCKTEHMFVTELFWHLGSFILPIVSMVLNSIYFKIILSSYLIIVCIISMGHSLHRHPHQKVECNLPHFKQLLFLAKCVYLYHKHVLCFTYWRGFCSDRLIILLSYGSGVYFRSCWHCHAVNMGVFPLDFKLSLEITMLVCLSF